MLEVFERAGARGRLEDGDRYQTQEDRVPSPGAHLSDREAPRLGDRVVELGDDLRVIGGFRSERGHEVPVGSRVGRPSRD